MHHSQWRVRIWPGNLRSVNKVTSFFGDRKVAGFVSLSMPFSQHCGAIYLRSGWYLVFEIFSDIMTKHCCQVCVLLVCLCRSDSRLCWPCWHGKWWRNRENLSTTWFDTPTGQRGKWYGKYSLRLIFTFYLNRHTRFLSPTDLKCAESSTYWQFFYYRPPGKFRWTSVNHFDKQREISLKYVMPKTYIYIFISLSLSLYIYIYIYIYICHTP